MGIPPNGVKVRVGVEVTVGVADGGWGDEVNEGEAVRVRVAVGILLGARRVEVRVGLNGFSRRQAARSNNIKHPPRVRNQPDGVRSRL